jgi:hypothetical protein
MGLASLLPWQGPNMEERVVIRISKIGDDSAFRLFIEGTLSDGWVDAVETSWLEAQPQLNGKRMRIDLSGVSYVDDKGRNLLARMMRCGAELLATGIMTRAVIEEITTEIESERDGGTTRAEFTPEQIANDGDNIDTGKLRNNQRTKEP